MKQLKGRSVFSTSEIDTLKKLMIARIAMPPDKQKSIRQKMRDIGFYGRDDWGINDCKIQDLDNLIKSGQIKVTNAFSEKVVDNIKDESEKLDLFFTSHYRLNQ